MMRRALLCSIVAALASLAACDDDVYSSEDVSEIIEDAFASAENGL